MCLLISTQFLERWSHVVLICLLHGNETEAHSHRFFDIDKEVICFPQRHKTPFSHSPYISPDHLTGKVNRDVHLPKDIRDHPDRSRDFSLPDQRLPSLPSLCFPPCGSQLFCRSPLSAG